MAPQDLGGPLRLDAMRGIEVVPVLEDLEREVREDRARCAVRAMRPYPRPCRRGEPPVRRPARKWFAS
jgi:hypothetical protein